MMRLLIVLLALAGPLRAEKLVLGLSHDEVAITANFDGSEILIFGAIKRDAPQPDGKLGVIITIEGPREALKVRRKERRLGIWVNTEAVSVDIAPTFYAVASNAPLAEVLNADVDENNRISISKVIRSFVPVPEEGQPFIDALVRIRAAEALYQVLDDAVEVDDETLFSAGFTLPANLTEGNYRAEIFLTRDGRIVDVTTVLIPVRKVGIERWMYRLAQDQAMIYGLLALAIAIAAGWAASAVFSLIRR